MDEGRMLQIIEEFDKACKHFGYENFLDKYRRHELPESLEEGILYEFDWETGEKLDFYKTFPEISNFYIRDICVNLQGFSIVTKNVAKELAAYIGDRKCLEIMAGLGAWSYALKQEGVDIISTDLKVETNSTFALGREWTEVEKLDCVEAIKKYNRSVVICSWPRYGSPFVEATKQLLNTPEAEMIHIGEGYGGCCLKEKEWDEIEKNFDVEYLSIHLQNWEGMHDSVYSIKNKT